MRKYYSLICILIIFLWPTSYVLSQEKCVNAEAESSIVDGDILSAKLKAIARAKWSAIEEVADTEITLRSFVQNFTLLEDIINAKTSEIIKSYKVLNQKNDTNSVNIRIKACVDPASAREALYQLGLNNSIAVFIPARKPGNTKNEFQETNHLAETLIDILSEQNYTVVDIASTQIINAAEIEKTVLSNSTTNLRNIMYKFLSNLIIIGKIDYRISPQKTDDISHDSIIPLNNVTVQLSYRIIAKNNKNGTIDTLATGNEEAQGAATEVENAVQEAMSELAQNAAPAMLNKIRQYIKDNTKKITVKVNDVNDIKTVKEIKEVLHGITWVSEVEEKQMGDFLVSYPENIIYLVNSIEQKSDLKVLDFSSSSINLEYRN